MSPQRHDLEALRPDDTPAYMTPAWLGCISFALHTPEIVEQFRSETGNQWQPAINGLDAMIDEATDAKWRFLEQFVRWVNVHVWGPVGGPQS